MSIESRLKRVEEQLEPEKGPWLRWPNPDGTVTEVPGCRSLNDPQIALAVAGLTDDDDRIRHNPTE